jgi:hypothetical protein
LQNYPDKVSANPRAYVDDARVCKPDGPGTGIVAPVLKLYVAYKKSHGLAAYIDALAVQGAMQQAAAARQLARLQGCFTKVFRPIGHEGGVGRAGHRILRHALRRSKKTRNEIYTVLARRGHDLSNPPGRARPNPA